MKKRIDVSMVVATHKGINKLPLLVSSLKKNSMLPKEIIICGTSLNDIKLLRKNDIKSLNIKFFISKIKNQVLSPSLNPPPNLVLHHIWSAILGSSRAVASIPFLVYLFQWSENVV